MEMRDEQVSRLSKEEVRLTMTKVYSIIRMDRGTVVPWSPCMCPALLLLHPWDHRPSRLSVTGFLFPGKRKATP